MHTRTTVDRRAILAAVLIGARFSTARRSSLTRSSDPQKLAARQGRLVTARGEWLIVLAVGGEYITAWDARSHRGGPLDEELVDGAAIARPRACSVFGAQTGEEPEPLAISALRTHEFAPSEMQSKL